MDAITHNSQDFKDYYDKHSCYLYSFIIEVVENEENAEKLMSFILLKNWMKLKTNASTDTTDINCTNLIGAAANLLYLRSDDKVQTKLKIIGYLRNIRHKNQTLKTSNLTNNIVIPQAAL